MSELATARKFQFVAGNLALDFCNTVGGKRGVVEREYLSSFLELAAWAHQAELLRDALEKAGVKVQLHLVKGASHGIGGREVNELVDAFFDKYLKGVDVKIAPLQDDEVTVKPGPLSK